VRARIVLTAAIAALAAAPNALAAFPGKNGLIAYTQIKHFSPDIWVVGPKGGKGRDITRTRRVREVSPSFSPNGRTIAFYWTNQSGIKQGIGTVGSNGKGLRHLTTGNGTSDFYGAPSWSADGKSILYTRGHNDANGEPVFEIWSIPAGGGAQRRLIGDGQPRLSVTSPIGPQLAYLTVDPLGQGEDVLQTSDYNGANAVRVGGQAPVSDWSPDGKRFVYIAHLAVTTRAADGSGSPLQIAKGPRRDEDPSYSPDGRFVIWSNEATHDLWIANAGGGGAHVFTHQPGFAKEPSWGSRH
jgi:Tol biopolymer transport system component